MLAAAGVNRVSIPGTVEFGNLFFQINPGVQIQVEACFKEFIRKYGCVLEPVDVFGKTNCDAAFFAELLDGEAI